MTSGRCDASLFNRCNDPNGSTTLLTFLDFDGEHTLEPLRPRHRVCLRFRVFLLFYWFLRHNMFTQFTVGRENPMKPGQVGPWSGYQRRQAPYEFHWAEHDM
jgi:hypothetical protein